MTVAFWLGLKAQLRSWRTWLMVLLMPALILGVRWLLPAQELAAPVQVGVCLPESGGEEFWNRLSGRSGTVVTFCRTDEQTLRQKVATGQWDCGMVLAEDFGEKLETADSDRLITMYISQSSTVYPLVQETAACTVLELMSPAIARNYARDQGIAGEFRTVTELTAEDQVQIRLQTLDGSPIATETLGSRTASNLLQGCIALLLLIWVAFSALDLGQWYRTPAAIRMKMLRTPAQLLLPRAAAALVPALVSALLGLVLLRGSWIGIPAVLAYLLTLGSMALLLCRWQGAQSVLPCLMPFAVVLSLVLSPMIFDISRLVPVLAPVCRYLPVSLFLTACGGSWEALGILAAEGSALLAVFTLTARKT